MCRQELSGSVERCGSPFGWNPPGSTPGGLAHVNPLLKTSGQEAGTPAPGSAPGPPSALGHPGQGLTGLLTPSPVSRRSDCMIWNVVV